VDLSWGLYFPLILIAAAFAIVSASAGVMAGRGNDAGAERLRNVGFLIVLVGAAWVVILTVLALISEPDDIGDMLTITLVIVVFFAILLVVLFGLSLVFRRLGRSASRRRRVTTDES
jgi:Kef-type K+ transport system membrane component KefB